MSWSNSEQVWRMILNRIDYMAMRHSRVLYIRFDVRYPTFFLSDGSNDPLVRTLKLFRNYFWKLGIEIQYLWAREQVSSNNPHYHVMVLVDGTQRKSPKEILETVNFYWKSSLGVAVDGLINNCTGDNGWCTMLQRPVGTRNWNDCGAACKSRPPEGVIGVQN
jgi:hypothetical protein